MTDKAIVALFGVNRMNFWLWLVVGAIAMGLAGFLMAASLVPQLGPAVGLHIGPLMSALMAISLLLLGIFALLLQLYCSLWAVKLDLLASQKASQENSVAAG